MRARIEVPQKRVAEFCRKWRVIEFSFFGSVLRDDFRADSDVDVMVAFAPDSNATLFDLVRMEEELKALFGREVDLVVRETIEHSRNYLRRKAILENREVIYAP